MAESMEKIMETFAVMEAQLQRILQYVTERLAQRDGDVQDRRTLG